ncbi:MAG: acetyl-CoA decarbonylase/synthase complex subunit gamma [Actinobacteria bacterium]|nr:acetyl-CoA decarbonylase/synthase complex subunit gamma [Actinomycetota bacterium]
MALTGMDIFKQLPKTNCGECGIPTCLAFAMKLAAGGASLEQCPHVSEEAKALLSEASAPPMRGVTIGEGEYALKIGEELVMHRHEKTFFNPPGLALLVEDTEDGAAVDAKLAALKEATYERVGQTLRADLVAVKNSSGDASTFSDMVKKVMAGISYPLVLMADAAAIDAAMSAAGPVKPLLHAATADNLDAMAALAKKYGAPLAVKPASLDELAELTTKLAGMGLKDLVIDMGTRTLKETFQNLVFTRRLALKKKQRPFGYPTITFPAEETADDMMETVHAAVYTIKYGGIMVLKDLSPEKAYALYVLRQNVYTDPQRPMQVDQGVYPINNPTEDSPFLVTTNFSLTYFIVSSEVEGSKMPAWLGIVDVDGLSTLTAWAAGKFVPERIAAFVNKSDILEKIKHKTVVIPGYVAQISGELEEELQGWKIVVGPREAADIPAFLKSFQTVTV